MPYPLLKLPYGLQQRLRSLATLKERYLLQIAVGSQKNYLGPLQIHNKHSKSTFMYLQKDIGRLDLMLEHNEALDCEDNNLHTVEGPLVVLSLEPSDYDSSFFDHIFFKCTSIMFNDDTYVTSAVLQKLTKFCKPELLTRVGIAQCTPDVTLRLLIDCFNNLDDITLKSLNYVSNWVHDILNFKNLNLKFLTFDSKFENLFNFELHELAQLYKEQDPEFELTLHCLDPPENAAELIRQKFGTNFKELIYNDGLINGVVEIVLGDAVEAYETLFFQVGKEN